MNVNEAKKKIQKYLNSEKSWPIIIDFQNRNDVQSVIDFFNVGDNKILPAALFCGQDDTFKFEEFTNALSCNKGNTFFVELSGFLKLNGEEYLRKYLKQVLQKSISGHVILFTYQCKDYLDFSDTRISERNQIAIVDGERDILPEICLISPSLENAFNNVYIGFDKISHAIETCNEQIAYIATNVDKKTYEEKSLITLSKMNNSYDILCDRDHITCNISESYGTGEQWDYALKLMGQDGTWGTIVESTFGMTNGLEKAISNYNTFDHKKRWLYYITCLLFDVNENKYFKFVLNKTRNMDDLIKQCYRAILEIDIDSDEYNEIYAQRKFLLQQISDYDAECVNFCKIVSTKAEKAIFYLTDNTQCEREKIIEWLDLYGCNYTRMELINILDTIYPDLSYYLSTYKFDNDFMNNYFEQYRYQKIINRLLPEFKAIVDEQSKKLDYLMELKSRASIVDSLNLENAYAYFVDALGVEYLGYIQELCNRNGLRARIMYGKCELPSLTKYNKEFIDTFKSKACEYVDIKLLDDIKHHGEESFDYEKVKKPLYLIKELEIIKDLINKIKINIDNDFYKKAIIVSDHGSSRLAVINESENLWKMETNGVHSGRCCPKNEINVTPGYALEKEEFWILPNYDRFQGGRKANVEVHGGATFEEVAVPIVEICKKEEVVEAFIVNESKKLILGAKENPIIKIFVGDNSMNISISINGDFYKAQKTDENYVYYIELDSIYAKKGNYTFDIYNGAELLASNQTFEVKKKGLEEVNLFGL